MTDLATLSGLGAALTATRAGFPARLARTAAAKLRELERAGRRRDDVTPTLHIPSTFADTLAAAITLDPDAPLAWHYLDTMPALHVEQLHTSAHPTAVLLHTPLDWSRLPRLAGAIARLHALVPTAAADHPATIADLYRRAYYGGFMPILYAYPDDLAAMARELASHDLHAVVDRWLAAPLIHELAHLSPARAAIFPGYLDECIAGWLSMRALPEFVYPAPGEANALFAAPWFAQVGQALARAVGEPALLAAHAGLAGWDDALGPLAAAAARLGWGEYLERRDPHFLSSNFRPEPWLKLFALASARKPLDFTLQQLDALNWADIPAGAPTPADSAALADGLRAMCTRSYQDRGAYRVARRPPPPITIDVPSRTISAAADGDPVAPRYPLPHAIAATLRQRVFTIQPPPDADLDAVARQLEADV